MYPVLERAKLLSSFTSIGRSRDLEARFRICIAAASRNWTDLRRPTAVERLSRSSPSAEQNQVLQELEAWGHPEVAEASRIAPSLDAASAEPGSELRRPPPRIRTISVDRALLFALFAAVREHTIEGMFCDPMYGGNKNFVGWRLVGFPGAQWGYSAEHAKAGFDATTIPIKSLADLRRERRSPSKQSQNEGGLS